MRNNFKSIALFISMSFAIQVSAETSELIDGIVYEVYNTANARIKSSSQEIDIAEILAKVNINGQEYVVDSIADRAFFNNKMTSVTIPSTINSIGEKAFYGCKGLTTLEIPSSVTYIGENAFEKCTSIESVSISSSIQAIYEGTFYDCFSLSSVSIPSSVTYIGKSAFSNCHSMHSVIIPTSVETIGPYAFYACDALKTVTVPSSVRQIGESAFWNCSSLESATISSSVTEIEYGTFYGCKSITSIVIPSSVTKIGERSFEQCESLPLVIIPPYITVIDEDAFKNCKSLYTIVSYPTTPPAISRNAFYMMPNDAVIYVPTESLKTYPTTEEWNVFHDFRALGSIDLVISSSELDLHVGEDAILTVSIDKAYDMTILSEEWTTTNPEVVIVNDGLITAIGEGIATICFVVIDGNGCPHSISCDVFVDGNAGIEIVDAEGFHDEPIEYYNLNGVRVNGETLAPGLYIKKQGNHSVKVLRN